MRPSGFGAARRPPPIARIDARHNVHIETQLNGLVVTGQVKTAADADRVMQIVHRLSAGEGQTLDNRLSRDPEIQVEPACPHRRNESQRGPPARRELAGSRQHRHHRQVPRFPALT